MRLSHRAATVVTAAVLLCSVRPARGSSHLVIHEVFFGTVDCPRAQYVGLRMYSKDQGIVSGKAIAAQNADGSKAPNFGTFDHNITGNVEAGAPVLVGTPEAQALFGIPFDQVVTGHLVFPDGRVCYAGSTDCVAYGDFTGNNGLFGTPAVRPELGQALVRISQSNDNSLAFKLGVPMPENNAGMIGTPGQCPAEIATPTPSSTPTTPTASPTPTATPRCSVHCTGSGSVEITDVMQLVNIALGAVDLSSCDPGDLNRDGHITIDEIITAVDSAVNGCAH